MSLAHLMHVLLAPDEEESQALAPAPAPPDMPTAEGGSSVQEHASGQVQREADQRAAERRERDQAKAEAASQRAEDLAHEEAWHRREEGHWAEEAARATKPQEEPPSAAAPAPPAAVGGVVPHDWEGNVRIGGAGGTGQVHPGVAYAKAPIKRKP